MSELESVSSKFIDELFAAEVSETEILAEYESDEEYKSKF